MDSGKQEIANVRREVAYKKKVAEEAGLDRLFLRAYHKSIRHYPAWIKSAENKKYVHPEIADATEKVTKDPFGETFTTDFSIRNKEYKIISRRKGTLLGHNIYYVVELFINGEKAFAVSEKHDLRLRDEHYYTLNVEAYLNEDWVEDFRKINMHVEKVAAAEELVPSEEDVELVDRLKKDFNIGTAKKFWFRKKPEFFLVQLPFLLIILLLTVFVAFVTIRSMFQQ